MRILIVEDEIRIREGIQKLLHKIDSEYAVVGEANDGIEGLRLCRELHPDLIITDVQMPGMDGLKMLEILYNEGIMGKAIVLSAYSEFEYARGAMKLGVTDYLLKPLPPGKLLECIRRVQEKIEQEREGSEGAFSEELAREQKDAEKNLLFRALVTNDRSLPEILAMADHLGIHISARYYAVMLMTVHGKENAMPDEELRTDLSSIPEQIDGWFFFDRNENGFALIGSANSIQELSDTQKKLLERLKKRLEADPDHTWFIGVGKTVNRISDIEKAYYSANKAFSWRFITGLNRVAFADEKGSVNVNGTSLHDSSAVFVPEVPKIPVELDVSGAVMNENSRKMLENYLKTGTYEEAEPFMEGVFDSIGEKNLGSYLFLTYLSMDLYFAMVRFLRELGRRVDEIDETCGDINTLLKNRVTVEEAREYLTGYLKELILLRDHNTEKRYSRILREAVTYIDENFDHEDISLNRVAQTIGMSPNHFSSIFSQEMGMTFIEYLISRRMERAKELLRTTQLRSSEIAYRVGYRDPHYFSSTFKKMQGTTPREYRMSCQEPGL